jgi:hypothetical protein
VNVSSDTSMFCIRASGATAVFMPCLDESLTLGGNVASNLIQLSSRETMIGREVNRVEPELACLVVPFDMHMHRLIAIEAVELKRYGPGMSLIVGITQPGSALREP